MDGGTRGQGKHSSGVRFCFSLVLLPVAPFHYAIEGAVVVGWGGDGETNGKLSE